MSRGSRPRRRPATTGAAAVMAHVALLALLALLVAACGGGASTAPAATSATPASSSTPGAGTPAASLPASPIEGVITHVESAGLNEVTAFTLRTSEGTLLTFRIGALENGTEFPPGHLTVQKATSDPSRVTFIVEGSELVATRLDDGGG